MKTGDIIDARFELRDVLGEGGAGQVFKAFDRDLQRFVAIKALLPQFSSDPSAMDEMKQEVLLSQRLQHPAIVAVYDYRIWDRTPYIVMEFVDGQPLHYYLYCQPEKRLDETTFRILAEPILEAVGYAHQMGVVHRDLKPANVMVMPDGRVKIMDFGIAAALKATFVRVSGHSSGLTIQYASPEQINGDDPAPSMDIYSLGCLFYEMLTGRPPFHQGDILHQHLTREPAPMAPVSATLNRAVLACLAKDPRKRLRSADDVQRALSGDVSVRLSARSQRAGRQLRTRTVTGGGALPGRARGLAMAAGALAILGLAGGAAYLSWMLTGDQGMPAPSVAGTGSPTPMDAARPALEPLPAPVAADVAVPPAPQRRQEEARTRPARQGTDVVAGAPLLQPSAQPGPSVQVGSDLAAATEALNQGRYDEAIERFATVLAVLPNNVIASGGLARARKAKSAEIDLLIQGRLTRATQSLERGDYDAAIADFEAVLLIDPTSTAAKGGAERAKRAKEAESKLKLIIKL